MIAPLSPSSRIPPSSSPMRRPVSNPGGRGGIRPPSHHVSWSGRHLLARRELEAHDRRAREHLVLRLGLLEERLPVPRDVRLHADRVLELQRPEERVDDVAAHVAERARAEVPPRAPLRRVVRRVVRARLRGPDPKVPVQARRDVRASPWAGRPRRPTATPAGSSTRGPRGRRRSRRPTPTRTGGGCPRPSAPGCPSAIATLYLRAVSVRRRASATEWVSGFCT